MESALLESIINMKKGSPVIVKSRDAAALYWEDLPSIYDYVREENCLSDIFGVEHHL